MEKSAQDTKVSKSMSFALRHDPEAMGIELTQDGRADKAKLAQAISTSLGRPVEISDIDRIIASDEKGRFVDFGDSVSAAQGHSVRIDLALEPTEPPKVLFHGTASTSVEPILASGISPMKRQFVHLSSEVSVATTVGARHGKVVVLTIDAERAHRDGVQFFQAKNGVWLAASIDASYVSIG